MKKIRMDIEISGHFAYRHSFLSDQLHCIKFELTSKMTIPFSHIHASLPIIQILRRVHQFGGRSKRNTHNFNLSKNICFCEFSSGNENLRNTSFYMKVASFEKDKIADMMKKNIYQIYVI